MNHLTLQAQILQHVFAAISNIEDSTSKQEDISFLVDLHLESSEEILTRWQKEAKELE